MSLINDALKRARETQRNTPPPGMPPLPPVESPSRGGAVRILAASAILFLAAAGIILGLAMFRRQVLPSASANTPIISTPPPVAAAPVPAANVAPVAAIVNPAPAAGAGSATAASPNPLSAAQTSPPPAAVPAEKMPKVQGVIFNSAMPLAIVNGQTVNVGDRVGAFQVKQITRNSVVFQRPDGTQKILGIGE